MCSVICRVGFEFISLGIQLEHISSKPKMSSARLCKVKLPNFPSWEGVGEAVARRSRAKWDGDGTGWGQGTAALGPRLPCQYLLHPQRFLSPDFIVPTSRRYMWLGKEQIFTEQ